MREKVSDNLLRKWHLTLTTEEEPRLGTPGAKVEGSVLIRAYTRSTSAHQKKGGGKEEPVV